MTVVEAALVKVAAPKATHGGEIIRLPPVPGQFLPLVQPEEAPEGPHGGENLQLHLV